MAYALVDKVSGGSGVTFTTGAINTTGSSLLTIVQSTWVVNPATVSDSKGNTWIPLTTFQDPGGGAQETIFYAVNPIVGAGHTFTATGTGSIFTSLVAAAFSGAKTVSPFDQQAGSVNNAYDNTNALPGSITPTENNELIICGFAFGISNTMTIDSSMIILDQVNFSGGVNFGVAAAFKVQTTAAAINPQWTIPSPPENGGIGIASFKAQPGGAVSSQRMLMGLGI